MDSLRQKRLSVGLSQRKLADLAGVRQATISDIEAGKIDPRLSTCEAIWAAIARFSASPQCSSRVSAAGEVALGAGSFPAPSGLPGHQEQR